MSGFMNLARETTSTQGTGTMTLTGAATGCLTFALAAAAAGVSSGSTVPYGIEDGAQSEVGLGVWTSPSTLTRVTVLASTNGGNKIDLSGEAEVFCMAPAEQVGFRGARVKKASSQNGANFTVAAAVTWDAEYFDVGGWHDTGSNPERLTVPSGLGITKVRVSGQIRAGANTADRWQYWWIRQTLAAGGTVEVCGCYGMEAGGTDNGVPIHSGVIDAVAGDYFEIFYFTENDTSVNIDAGTSWFCIEAVP